MKKITTKYITAAFFIMLFILKGSITALPGLFTIAEGILLTEKLFCSETGDEQKDTEEKSGQEFKIFYLPNHQLICFIGADICLQQKITRLNQLLYRQAVYVSIPTPPPELA